MIWYETEWPRMLDIDLFEFQDPAPSPEETYSALEAWVALRRKMERAYGPAPARATEEEEEEHIRAVRQTAKRQEEARQLAAAKRAARALDDAGAPQRFARDRAALLELAEKRIDQGLRWNKDLPLEHFFAEQTVFAIRAAQQRPSGRVASFEVTMGDGTIYSVAAKSAVAARGMVLLDTEIVEPEHRVAPPGIAERLFGWEREPGVIAAVMRAWLVPIMFEGRTLQCIVGAVSKARALQAVRDDSEVHAEWKSDEAFMQVGTTALSDERVSWMRTADSNLRTMLAASSEPRVLGILRDGDAAATPEG